MTFLENIAEHWQSTYSNCDPTVEGDAPKYSLGWFTEGAFYGVKMGVKIGQDVKTEDQQRAFDSTWNVAKRQGIAQAAFLASNISLSRTYSDEVMQGAALMRELIVLQLQEAAKE